MNVNFLPMTLADAKLDEPLVVQSVGGERSFRRRLMELGLVPGTEVRVLKVAPLGDPLELRVRGGTLSIRADEARTVGVAPARSLAAPRAAESATWAPEPA
jgi:Fe2+ transport system protein FeoA